MRALETLRALAAGRGANLLADCRFEGFGTAAYGPDAIGALFARYPSTIAATPHVVATPGAIALFDACFDGTPVALIADLVDGHVARLWRIGPHTAVEPVEPAVAVPFDTDMHQLAVTDFFAASDHPWLDRAGIPALLEVMGEVAAAGASSRSRALCLRAFSQGNRGAALIYRHAPPDRAPRQQSAHYVAAQFSWHGTQPMQSRWLADAVPEIGWTPRFDEKLSVVHPLARPEK